MKILDKLVCECKRSHPIDAYPLFCYRCGLPVGEEQKEEYEKFWLWVYRRPEIEDAP